MLLFVVLAVVNCASALLNSPQEGVEYKTGKTLRIKWNPIDLDTNSNLSSLSVVLQCRQSDVNVEITSEDLPLTATKFYWNIPYDFEPIPSANCSIRLLGNDYEKNALVPVDTSGEFRIVKGDYAVALNKPVCEEGILRVSWMPPQVPLGKTFDVVLVKKESGNPVAVLQNAFSMDDQGLFEINLSALPGTKIKPDKKYFLAFIEKPKYIRLAVPGKSTSKYVFSQTFKCESSHLQPEALQQTTIAKASNLAQNANTLASASASASPITMPAKKAVKKVASPKAKAAKKVTKKKKSAKARSLTSSCGSSSSSSSSASSSCSRKKCTGKRKRFRRNKVDISTSSSSSPRAKPKGKCTKSMQQGGMMNESTENANSNPGTVGGLFNPLSTGPVLPNPPGNATKKPIPRESHPKILTKNDNGDGDWNGNENSAPSSFSASLATAIIATLGWIMLIG